MKTLITYKLIFYFFSFKITGKFNSKSLNEHINLPTLYTKIQLQHLDIDTKYEKLLFVEQFTIDSTVRFKRCTQLIYSK